MDYHKDRKLVSIWAVVNDYVGHIFRAFRVVDARLELQAVLFKRVLKNLMRVRLEPWQRLSARGSVGMCEEYFDK